jgi:hypothetical protein
MRVSLIKKIPPDLPFDKLRASLYKREGEDRLLMKAILKEACRDFQYYSQKNWAGIRIR